MNPTDTIPTATVMKVAPDEVEVRPELQPRGELNPDTVADYQERMRAGDLFPPLLCYRVTDRPQWRKPVVCDGGHRHAGHVKNGSLRIDVEIREGTFAEAWLAAFRANLKNALQYSPQQKRHAIERALLDVFKDTPGTRVAQMLGVSQQYVSRIRNELVAAGNLDENGTVVTADGKVRSATNSEPRPEPRPTPAPSRATVTTPVNTPRPKPEDFVHKGRWFPETPADLQAVMTKHDEFAGFAGGTVDKPRFFVHVVRDIYPFYLGINWFVNVSDQHADLMFPFTRPVGSFAVEYAIRAMMHAAGGVDRSAPYHLHMVWSPDTEPWKWESEYHPFIPDAPPRSIKGLNDDQRTRSLQFWD